MTKLEKLMLVAFMVLFLFTRFPRLHNDTINPDGVNWHYRSQQFIVGLKYFQFEKTYQHYHPGVTLMWVTGVPIELYKQVIGISQYDQFNFQAFDFVAKSSLVFVQAVLSLIIIFFLSKSLGYTKSIFIVALLSLEPFFVGNSRLYHMDSLLTLLIFLTLLLIREAFTKPKNITFILCGLLMALSFLTKSISIGLYPYFLIVSFLSKLTNQSVFKDELKRVGVITLSFIFFTFLFFPALWKAPLYYLGEIFSESERVGVRKGHEQIILGDVTNEAGLNFYPLVLFLKVSPFTWIGILLFLVLSVNSLKTWKEKHLLSELPRNLLFQLTLFYVVYFIVMSFPTKKIDRYMLVLFPYLSFLALFGWYKLIQALISHKRKIVLFISLLFFMFIGLPLVTFFPYYFTYASPLVGNEAVANGIIAQKPFGIGMYSLKDTIMETYTTEYGSTPTLGFIDTKPMKAIYSNSKVFDIRTSGTSSYDLLILGVNESMPEKIVESKTKFKLDTTITINGLEYWRIYVKEK